jgi:GntR family transcriptional regulator/MocR family aminotransferase
MSMPRRAGFIKQPEIMLDTTLSVPLYKQLYERLRGAILAGQLERGARLPSTRTLASELGVSRTTTVLAYELLLLEGYLESRAGQGTVVAHDVLATLSSSQTRRTPSSPIDVLKTVTIPLASRVRSLKDMPPPPRRGGQVSEAFSGGEPALDLFPYEVWARLIARRARQSLREVAHYQPPAGYFPLR